MLKLQLNIENSQLKDTIECCSTFRLSSRGSVVLESTLHLVCMLWAGVLVTQAKSGEGLMWVRLTAPIVYTRQIHRSIQDLVGDAHTD